MSEEKLTLEEVKSKTLELLGSTNLEDVEYITQEMVDEDHEAGEQDDSDDDKELAAKPMYGHNMRYYGRKYKYDRGSNKYSRSDGCKSTEKGRTLSMDKYNHFKDGDCSSRDARLRFERR
ncbi:MAG: hypothetical protein O7D86_09200 [Proteobacteria bacterium]|nr:hypothetical protein [Pseudomonadota bacterium]